MSKIKLLIDLPIEKRHGAFKGKVFDRIREKEGTELRDSKYWFIGDAGLQCAAFFRECEVIE